MNTTKKKADPRGGQAIKNQDHSSKKKTQKQVVLEELKAHRDDGVTSWDFITKHHITRAASYICDYRKEGYDIRSVNEAGEGSVVYSRYFYVGGPDEGQISL